MQASITNARRVQVAFVVLLVVCAAQVGWWLVDQWLFSTEVNRRAEEALQRNLAAAEARATRGVEAEAIVALFPDIETTPAGLAVDPEVRAALEEERRSRINQYAWEGGFFLVVLVATIGVLASAVRSEGRLRRRQHNFVTAVTHELKSPLAAMRLAAETLELRESDAETRQRLLRRLLTSLDRMESTVANVLDTARVDEGKFTIATRSVDVVGVIDKLVDDFATTAESRDIDLRAELPPQLALRADDQALEAVLRNLLGNALGAVSDADPATVLVSVTTQANSAIIEVRDNGRGFDPQDAEKLFEKFYRLGDEMQRRGRGTGLGLYIARSLSTASDAKLSAHSDGPGRGASFRLEWPLA
jgi:signal transduction histidine kinase